MTLQMLAKSGALVACSVLRGTAWAAALEVRVSDAAGKPLANAVVFLESREAKAA